jgi:hypothetical protein
MQYFLFKLNLHNVIYERSTTLYQSNCRSTVQSVGTGTSCLTRRTIVAKGEQMI